MFVELGFVKGKRSPFLEYYFVRKFISFFLFVELCAKGGVSLGEKEVHRSENLSSK